MRRDYFLPAPALLLFACCFTAAAQPTITSVSPGAVPAGSAAFQLTVNGSGFVTQQCPSPPCAPLSVVVWSGTALATTYVNSNQLVATVPANLLLSPVTVSITVSLYNGYFVSAPFGFSVTYPVPVITSISPGSASAGSPAFNLLVSGTGLYPASVVQWNGASLPTTLVPTRAGIFLSAAVPASLLTQPGTAGVTVVNPGQPASNIAAFAVGYLTPAITSIAPSQTNAGGAAFQLIVNGLNFGAGSVVNWNGLPLPSDPFPTQIAVTVPASLIATAGVALITVTNPGQPLSNAVPFLIIGPPTLTSVSPNNSVIGGAGVTLTVTGVSLQPSSAILFNGQPLPTTFVSPTQLTATLSNTLFTTPGTSLVSVMTAGQPNSNALPFNVGYPPVAISTLSPTTLVEGSPAFTLTVSGSGFYSGQTSVFWNGQALPTTFVSSGQLTAAVPASLVAKAATAVVQAGNPNLPLSNGISFVITPTPIAITSLSPAAISAGAPSFLLTVTGSGFLAGVSIVWNGTPLPSTYVSGTQVTATIPAALIANAVSVAIRAANPNGPQSNLLTFTVGQTAPSITSLSPPTLVAGGPDVVLNVIGSGFQSGASVLWNGLPLTTTFLSPTQLNATLPASLTSVAGSANVSVSSGSAVSSNVTFAVTAGALTIAALSPNAATAGDPALTLTVTGSGFTTVSVVQWNGSPLPTSFVGATQLTASVPSSLISNPGSASVTVGNSNALAFTIRAKLLTVTGLNPASATAGSGGLTLTLTGAGFAADAIAYWNTTALATTVVGAGQLTATVPASLLMQPGPASVSVASGGVTSAAFTFTVALPPAPAVTLSTLASTGPAQQPPITFALGTPYPLPLSGTITLTFAPNALVPGDDPAIQFASGGRTLGFNVAANSVSLPALMLQTGTVAGTVTLSLKLTTSGIDVTPQSSSTLTLQIARQAPVIRTVLLVRNTAGIEVDITGYATSREITQATFHFNTAAGSNLQIADFTVPLTGTFAAWYASAPAAPYGSQFTYAQPFAVSGSPAAITSVTVTLTNSIGVSQAVTSN